MTVILRLTNSDDFNERVAPADRGPEVAARVFQELTGETVTTDVRLIWPEPRMPDLLSGWLEKTRPDMVILRCAAYWVTFRSVPLRVKRLLGPAGRPLVAAGNRSTQIHWLAESRPYNLARQAVLRTVGGDTNFTVPEVIEVLEGCIRRILALEGPALVVRGPQAPSTADLSPRGLAWAENRRLEFDKAMRSLCEKYRIDYFCRLDPTANDTGGQFYFGDLVHASAELHRLRGEEEGRALADAWLREHGRPSPA